MLQAPFVSIILKLEIMNENEIIALCQALDNYAITDGEMELSTFEELLQIGWL